VSGGNPHVPQRQLHNTPGRTVQSWAQPIREGPHLWLCGGCRGSIRPTICSLLCSRESSPVCRRLWVRVPDKDHLFVLKVIFILVVIGVRQCRPLDALPADHHMPW
jgi:hypothetical protein